MVGKEEEIMVPSRLLGHVEDLFVGEIGRVGEELQFLLNLPACIGDEHVTTQNVLIDTGAQIKLINERLVPSHLKRRATRVVRLVAANGQPLRGGIDASRWREASKP